MNILVTGGTGYIGSHICVELLENGHDVVVIDDFSNSKPDVLDSIYKITGKHVKFYEFNVLDEEKTEAVFAEKVFPMLSMRYRTMLSSSAVSRIRFRAITSFSRTEL